MSWPARTWVHAELVTASLMNGYLRDPITDLSKRVISASFGDVSGIALTTGLKGFQEIPFAGTITGWTVLADAAGSVVIDVWKDTYCVDDETEALTPRGWVKWSEIGAGDALLGFDAKTGKTSWQRPTGMFIDKDYVGPMIRIGREGGRFNALVTPNHSWPVIRISGRAERRGPIESIETRNFPQKCLLLRSAPYAGPERPTLEDALVRLAAWFFTEGSTRAAGKIASITQSERVNPKNCAAIRADLKTLGATWSQSTGDGKPRRKGQRGSLRRVGLWVREHKRPDGTVQFCLSGTRVDELVGLFPGKLPTPAFVGALTAEQARMFVRTALDGDGNGDGIFYQHDEARMSAFMAIAVLAGYSPSLDKAGTCCSLRQRRPYTWIKDTPRSTEAYSGVVWCPTMPTGYWVARRAGKVFITGNSNFPPTIADTITGTEKPTLSAQQKNQDLSLSSWTTSITSGDILGFNIDSAATVKQVGLFLRVTLN